MAAKSKKWEKTKYIGIEKRDDGKYRVVLDYGNVTDYNAKTGKIEPRRAKTRRVVGTLMEAQVMLAEVKRGKSTGISAKAGEQILKDVAKVYWERNKERYAESSWSSIEHHLRVINEFMGEVRVKDINKNKVEDFCDYMYEKRGLGYKSIVKIKSTLSNVFTFMLGAPEIYGIERNPCRLPDLNIKAPKPKKGVDKHEPHPMTEDGVNITINDIIKNEDDRAILAIFALGVIGGLRRSEIAGLTKANFYAEKDKMLIKDVVIKGEHCQNVNKDCTKDGAFRYVARPKILTKIIEYCMEQTATLQGYRSIKDIPDTDRIVRPVREILTGKVTSVDKLYERWRDYQLRRNRRLVNLGQEEIEPVRLHDLRHTHAHLMVMHVPVIFISHNMGHSTEGGGRYATTTEKVYLQDTNDRRAVNAFWNNKNTCPIKIDWESRNRIVLTSRNTSLDGSGHLKIN